jgi:Bacterial SH3 domain
MRAAHWLWALAFAFAMPAAQAETVYVIEQLVVGVNSAPDEGSERVASIKSGDRVELLEREDEQAHIRLQNGTEGWVKASYLSTDPPLQQRLDARTQEVTKLKTEVSRLESELKTVRLAATAPAAPAPAPPPAEPSRNPDVAARPSGNRPLFHGDAREKSAPSWKWTAGVGAASLLLGFALGWRMLDRRIRAKYGGLRIY